MKMKMRREMKKTRLIRCIRRWTMYVDASLVTVKAPCLQELPLSTGTWLLYLKSCRYTYVTDFRELFAFIFPFWVLTLAQWVS